MNEPFDKNRSCLDCQFKSILFKLLSEQELEMLDKNKTAVYFKKGETIRKQGAVLTHVISLNSGLAKVYLEGTSNKNLMLGIISPTSFIGGPGMFVDRKNHFTVTSLTDSCACYIELSSFRELLHLNMAFADEYFKHLSKVTLSAYNRLINFTQKQMAGRLADTLIYLSEEIFESRKFQMLLSKNDLAELSGMSKDNVVRTLKNFCIDGHIAYSGNDIEIKDFNSLQNISRLG